MTNFSIITTTERWNIFHTEIKFKWIGMKKIVLVPAKELPWKLFVLKMWKMFESVLQKVSKFEVTYKNKHWSSLIKGYFWPPVSLFFKISLLKGRPLKSYFSGTRNFVNNCSQQSRSWAANNPSDFPPLIDLYPLYKIIILCFIFAPDEVISHPQLLLLKEPSSYNPPN